jgi:hypothetical protein
MANLKVAIEIEIPDTNATYEQLDQFVGFYICQEGSIGPDNPLYNAEYEIKDFSVD